MNSHALPTVPVYKKNRIASLLCIFETIILSLGRLEYISGYVGNTTESLIFCDYNDGLTDPFKSLVLGCQTPILGDRIRIYAGKDGGKKKHVVLSLSEVSIRTVDHPGNYTNQKGRPSPSLSLLSLSLSLSLSGLNQSSWRHSYYSSISGTTLQRVYCYFY